MARRHAPYGYRWQDGTLVVAGEEAAVLRLLYHLFVEHRRKKTVARLLNESGHRTRGGAKFTDTTIGRLLHAGDPKGLVVEPETLDECRRILDDRRAGKRPARRPVHLFAGILHCACGSKLYVPSSSPGRYVCRRCRNKMPLDVVEAVFLEQIRDMSIPVPSDQERTDSADDQAQLLEALVRERQRTRRALAKLHDLHTADHVEQDEFGRRHAPLQERLAQLDAEIPRIQADVDVAKIRQALSRRPVAERLDQWWRTLRKDERRRIVESVAERIVVGRDDVEVRLWR